jgi:predicted dehydrogenase
LVFAEKPLANTEKEAEKILKLYKQKNIPVVVNYSRRFVPEFKRIKRNVEMGSYGDFITGIGYYGKGLLHNGSHLIDLLRWFLGEIKKSTIIDSFIDFDKNDPSVSAVLNFKKKKNFFLQSVNCNVFTIFEIDLLFEKKRIVIKDSGLRIKEYAIRENNIFKGYKNLVRTKEIKTSIYNSTFHAVENIYAFLNKGKALDCNLEDGYKTMKTCLDILGKKNRQQ